MSGLTLPSGLPSIRQEPIVNDRGEKFFTALVGRGAAGQLVVLVPFDGDGDVWLLGEFRDREANGMLDMLDAHARLSDVE